MFNVKFSSFLFLFFFTPMAIFPTYQQSVKEVENLLKQEKYDTACEKIAELLFSKDLSDVERGKALTFAVDKAKYFVDLNIEEFDEAECDSASFCEEFGYLICLIIDEFSVRSMSSEDFVEQILQAVYKKWPYVVACAIEEFCSTEKGLTFDDIEEMIKFYLNPEVKNSIRIFLSRLEIRYVTMHNLVAAFHYSDNLERIETGDLDLSVVVEFGGKFIDHFFTEEQEVIKNKLLENYDVLKAMHDKDSEEDFWLMSEVDKESFVGKYLNVHAGKDATLALSISLCMKKADAISYIKKTYNKLIEFGYLIPAEGLKLYIANPTKDDLAGEDFNYSYFITNPKHFQFGEFVEIPEYLKQAFVVS